MRSSLVACFSLILILSASAGLAAADNRQPAFAFTPQPTAMRRMAEKGGIAVILKGDGWYVGNPAYAKSGVPFVAGSPGISGYTCPIAASAHDQGDRKAEVIDRFGNVLASFDGKSGDRQLPALVAKSQEFLTGIQAEMRTCLTRGKAQLAKNPAKAKEILTPLAAIKGWPEAEEAKRLVASP